MAKVSTVINDGAEYIKWELSYAQGLQYEMIFWTNKGYGVEMIVPVHRGHEESLSDIFNYESDIQN